MKLSKKEIIEIIQDEITVDAYGDDEVSSGWSVFMEDNINYPFEAEYKIKWKNGKSIWKKIIVLRNESSSSSTFPEANYYVEVELDEMIISVKLDDLRKVNGDLETQRALEVWKNRNSY